MDVDTIDWPDRWKHIHTFLDRPGPFAAEGFAPGEEVKEFFTTTARSDSKMWSPKAVVAAEFINRRVPGVKSSLSTANSRQGRRYYSQFSIIYAGQSRVIIPRMTACYECSLEMQTNQDVSDMHYRQHPRLPEHCIEWASVLEWPRLRNGERGEEFNISGVTYTLTQGLLKHYTAIASTNVLADLIDVLLDRREVQLKKPSLRTAKTSLYMQRLRGNLLKKLGVDWRWEGVTVTDDALPISMSLQVVFKR
ncbi:hypothetical protein BC829DRAFT_412096 [Chytridium lagenaria]|nr:hypothetical protein BC829DRAFT_412096 [Chytridium lagenaria]